MQTKTITCPRCSARNIKKNGTTGNRKQKYLCKKCNRQFITEYKYQGCRLEVVSKILPMSLNGSGIRDISRVLQISTNTVLKHLKESAKRVRRDLLPKRITELEIDEMWSFVGNKENKAWLWYAFDPKTKRILTWVVDRRTDAACRRLLKQLEGCYVMRFCTDDWESYSNLLPDERHWIGKQWTHEIERENLNFRTHLKRLQRKTICFSKSKLMHKALIKLYIKQHNLKHKF